WLARRPSGPRLAPRGRAGPRRHPPARRPRHPAEGAAPRSLRLPLLWPRGGRIVLVVCRQAPPRRFAPTIPCRVTPKSLSTVDRPHHPERWVVPDRGSGIAKLVTPGRTAGLSTAMASRAQRAAE